MTDDHTSEPGPAVTYALTPPAALDQEGARARAGERFRTVRALIVAVVVMWVVLVAAWAADKAVTQAAFADQRQQVEEARKRLAGVEELSGVFNEVATVVEPAVVKLDVIRVGGRAGPMGRPIPEANSGSGVIMETDADSERAWVVTNNHVVTNAARIAVTLSDGRTVEGRIVGTDPESDLAVVVIEAPHLIAAQWGNSDTLRKGDWVLAFGSPFNFVGSMTAGIVSALNRTQNDNITTPLGDDAYQNFIQVDAAINPGNSGGPLANVRGEIVGINTAIFSRTGDFSGIGFSIPSNQARRVYEDIRERGRFVRGWLGVSVAPIAAVPQLAADLGFDGSSGVIITQVYRDTPAARGNLQRNDIILSIDDRPVRDGQTLRNITAFAEPGEQVLIRVFRDGETVELPLKIGEMPDDLLSLRLEPQFDPVELGLSFQDSQEGPVQITSVAPDSPASQAGLQPGDYILRIGGQPIQNTRQALALLAQLDPDRGIEMTVASGNRMFNVLLRR